MSASLVVVRNPFDPMRDREQRPIQAGGTLAALAPQMAVAPFIILVNGQAVLREGWGREVVADDMVAIIFLPRGGGGGGSNPLKIILSVAIAVFAPYVSGFIGTAFGTFGMTAANFMMVSNAIVGLAGNALVNAVAGGSTPKGTTAQQAAALASPSPTYNLQAQGNMARLDAAIPVQYGRMMCFPDYASQPYVEYAGNEQFLYSLLCIGAGEYDIEQIRIEDTDINNWEEITSETIGPHGAVTLFPTNVTTSVEVAGAEMVYNTYLGPFVAHAAETTANALGLDFVFARGLYYANDAGGLNAVTVTWTVEARPINDAGAPIGAGTYTTLGNESLTAATTTPQRVSKRYTVTAGRYEVRVKRTSSKYTDSRYGNDIAWAGLRAYLPDTRDFGDVTLLALRMRATNNLSSQASRKINVICTRKLPAWNGSAFGSKVATSSIAWALANACTDATWSAGLANTRVDLAGLLALNAIWQSRGDEFNGRFDSTISFWEAITKIARAGRAYPYMQGGIIRFSRDQAQTTPVALFSMRNIVRGSFQVQYLTPSEAQADACEVSYFDDAVWAQRRVQAKLTGSTASKPVKIEYFGITDRSQAFREGVYESACNRYRRKIIKFATEMEGFIPSFGDLIAVSHDMVQWGQHAEVTSYDIGSNLVDYSSAFNNASWTKTATCTASTIDDTSNTVYQHATNGIAGAASGLTTCVSLYVAKDAIPRTTRFMALRFIATGVTGSKYADLRVDTSTGESNVISASATVAGYGVEDAGDDWRIWIAASVTDAAMTGANFVIYPAVGASATWVYSSAAMGSISAWGAQAEFASSPGPYVPTTSSAITNASVLTLTEPMAFSGVSAHYVGLRKRNGSVDGPIAAVAGATANELVLAAAPAFTPYTGQNEERTHIVFGVGETWRQPARVLAVRPRGLDQVEIECVNEDASVHTAETGLSPAPAQYSQLDTRWTAPTIEGLTAWSMPGSSETMLLSWRPAAGADHYLIEQSSDGDTWTRTGETSTSNYTARALYGSATLVRIAAVGMTRGPWVTVGYGGFADYMWSANSANLMWSATSTDRMWRY